MSMESPVLVRRYAAPSVDTRAMLAFAGVRSRTPDMEALLLSALAEAQPALSYAVCFCELPLAIDGDTLRMGELTLSSHALAKSLCGCDRAVIFGATVGHSLDRLIARYGTVSPTRALMLQAIGAERIEALCDRFCEELSAEAAARGMETRTRFSPGYGDLPLAVQADLFRILDCPRRIGLTLNQSLVMSPSKSVTAIVGLSPKEC